MSSFIDMRRRHPRRAKSGISIKRHLAFTALLLLTDLASGNAAEPQGIEQRIAVCKACHLGGRTPSNLVIPNIWGQSEGYIYIQLRDFKSGARNAPEDAAMRGFVAGMSDANLLEIAKYASAQAWPSVDAPSSDAELLKRGAYATALIGCSGCHFNAWRGFGANPRIGGQSTAYLAATIRQFRSGSRANSPGMSDLVRTIDESDIDAVAAFLNAAP